MTPRTDELVVNAAAFEASSHTTELAPPRVPLIVGDWWDVHVASPRPGVLPVAEAEGLFYAGRVNAVWGEPNRGKSLLCQHLAVTEAAAGRSTLTIDLEKPLSHFRSRVEALGATRASAQHIGYWNPERAITETAVGALIGYCDQQKIRTVIIDAVGRATAQLGIDDNVNADYRQWFDAVIVPLERAGLTIVLVDHPRKDFDRSGAPLYPKGAGAKLDVIDGAAYALTTVTAFNRERSGRAQLVCAKDTEGARSVGEPAADMLVSPGEGGRRITVTLTAPEPRGSRSTAFRPTSYMEDVLRVLAAEDEPLSISELKRRIGKKGEWVGVAVERLLEDGAVTETAGPRNARLISRCTTTADAADEHE